MSVNIEILAGATVREIILKYNSHLTKDSPKGASFLEDYLNETKVIYRLEFGRTLLRKDQRIRDVGIVNGSHIIVAIKSDDEPD